MEAKLGLSAEASEKICKHLSKLLANTYMLYLKTHNFHWNVTGPKFFTLHKMFEEQYLELATAVDEIAERIRTLGHRAPGTFIEYSELSEIKEHKDIPSADDMIKILAEDNEKVAQIAKEGVKPAEDGGDDPTADMLIARAQIHEKTAWMLRSSQG